MTKRPVLSVDQAGNRMVLLKAKNTSWRRMVYVGQQLKNTSGKQYIVTGGRAPQEAGSMGFIQAKRSTGGESFWFYPAMFGCEWARETVGAWQKQSVTAEAFDDNPAAPAARDATRP
jgi:hypothetical protein